MKLSGKASHFPTFPVLVVCFALSASGLCGCGKKEAAAPVAPGSLKGQAPPTPTGEVKGTPEQEAAKQQAIQQGPAIEAALKEQQDHK